MPAASEEESIVSPIHQPTPDMAALWEATAPRDALVVHTGRVEILNPIFPGPSILEQVVMNVVQERDGNQGAPFDKDPAAQSLAVEQPSAGSDDEKKAITPMHYILVCSVPHLDVVRRKPAGGHGWEHHTLQPCGAVGA